MANDFGEDIRQHVLKHLPHKQSERATLLAMHVVDLLTLYFNWRGRYVPARPRTVHRSAALSANPLAVDPTYKLALDHIINLIETGQDLKPHLSRGIDNKYQLNAPPHKSHLDLLLNDWGIHHMHLSTVKQPDGFVQRTGPLLFAVFGRDDAYLIDIINKHGKWADDNVIRIIVKEWPNAGIVIQLQWISGLPTPISKDQRQRLRESGFMCFVAIDGSVYAPPRTLTTAGTSMEHVEAAEYVLRRVRAFEEDMKNDPNYVASLFEQQNITPPPTLDLHFAFFSEEDFGILEKNTGVGIYLTR